MIKVRYIGKPELLYTILFCKGVSEEKVFIISREREVTPVFKRVKREEVSEDGRHYEKSIVLKTLSDNVKIKGEKIFYKSIDTGARITDSGIKLESNEGFDPNLQVEKANDNEIFIIETKPVVEVKKKDSRRIVEEVTVYLTRFLEEEDKAITFVLLVIEREKIEKKSKATKETTWRSSVKLKAKGVTLYDGLIYYNERVLDLLRDW